MEINYILSTYPTLLQNMVARVYETNAPNAEIQAIIIPETNAAGVAVVGGGHNKQATVTFTGLELSPHILRLFTASGTLLHEFNVQPYAVSVTVFNPIYFRIGDGAVGTPIAGTSTYNNAALAGLDNFKFTLHRTGVLKYPTVDYNSEPSGGFNLAILGDVFGTDEEFLITQIPQVVSNLVNDSVVGKQFGPTTGNVNIYVDVTSTVNYAATHLRKIIRLSGVGVYNFNAPVPIGYPFRFINMVSGTPIINFLTVPLIRPGGNVTSFTLPAQGIIEVVFDGAFFNLVSNNTQSLGAMPFGTITYAGQQAMGNILAAAGNEFTVVIPDQLTVAYKVFGTFKSVFEVNAIADCVCVFDIAFQSATSFKVRVREFTNSMQNLLFDYVIVKIN